MREAFEVIERALFWTGRVNRADLREALGVSEATASRMLSAYRQEHGGMTFRPGGRGGYVATDDFRPRFYVPKPQHSPIPVLSPKNLPDRLHHQVLMQVSRAAARQTCVEIDYLDSKGVRSTRAIQPVCWIAIDDNIMALHAWCYLRQAHRTFDLAGIQALRPSFLAWNDALGQSPELRKVQVELEGVALDVPIAGIYPLVVWAMGQPALRTPEMKAGIDAALRKILPHIQQTKSSSHE